MTFDNKRKILDRMTCGGVMRITVFCGAAAILLFTANLPAQNKPDFSGKWVLDWTSIPVPPGATGPGTGPGRGAPQGGALGEEFIATQTSTMLTIEYAGRRGPVKFSYKLDGSENKNLVSGREAPVEQTSSAVWQGNKLVVTTNTEFGKQKRVFSLGDGHLVLDIEQPIPEGPPIVSKIRYKRQ